MVKQVAENGFTLFKLDCYDGTTCRFADEIEDLRDRLARAEAALQAYADPNNWGQGQGVPRLRPGLFPFVAPFSGNFAKTLDGGITSVLLCS